jgi:hypothetical protein
MLKTDQSIFKDVKLWFPTGPMRPHEVDSRYIISLIDKLFPFLPKRLKNYLHFGYTFRDEKQTPHVKTTELSSHESSNQFTINEAFEFDIKTLF